MAFSFFLSGESLAKKDDRQRKHAVEGVLTAGGGEFTLTEVESTAASTSLLLSSMSSFWRRSIISTLARCPSPPRCAWSKDWRLGAVVKAVKGQSGQRAKRSKATPLAGPVASSPKGVVQSNK
eukprot:1195338-Prorocentrum_minimum.AAC.6